jgi:hypothetical protein
MPDQVQVRIGRETLTAEKNGRYWIAGPTAANAGTGDILQVETPSGVNVRGYCARAEGFPVNDADCVLLFRVPCDSEVWALNVRSDPDESEFKYARISGGLCQPESDRKFKTPADIKWIGKSEQVVVKIFDPRKIFLCNFPLALARFDEEETVVLERAKCTPRPAERSPGTNSPQDLVLGQLQKRLPFSRAEFTLKEEPRN